MDIKILNNVEKILDKTDLSVRDKVEFLSGINDLLECKLSEYDIIDVELIWGRSLIFFSNNKDISNPYLEDYNLRPNQFYLYAVSQKDNPLAPRGVASVPIIFQYLA